jgi:excisionase family DNA binding protein
MLEPMHTAENASLLTVPEVAARWKVSRSTVWRRIAAGELPAVRIGSGPHAPVRVDPAALDDFLHGASGKPPADEVARTSHGSPGGGLAGNA